MKVSPAPYFESAEVSRLRNIESVPDPPVKRGAAVFEARRVNLERGFTYLVRSHR
jgi:hypothetical protein